MGSRTEYMCDWCGVRTYDPLQMGRVEVIRKSEEYSHDLGSFHKRLVNDDLCTACVQTVVDFVEEKACRKT